MLVGATYARELSVEDFKFDGPLGSAGATIERVDINHFKVVLGHAPEHPTWCNMLQFQILQNAKGNRLRLDVYFYGGDDYRFNHYAYSSWSYNGIDWHPIKWQKEAKKSSEGDTLLFPEFKEDTVYFGHQVPMSYQNVREMMETWDKHPHARVYILGKSLEGRNIYRLEITDPQSPHPRDRRWVHYFGNQHPGEHNAQWRMVGMIEWLLSKAGRDCRHRSISHFVLMMYPDAPSHGWYRTGIQGVDGNRSYSVNGANQQKQAHEAYIVQKDLERLMSSDASVTDLWSMHTWGGVVEPIMLPGPEMGTVLPTWTQLRDIMEQNDPERLVKPLAVEKKPGNTSHWNNGPHVQFGITTVLCEGAGSIITKQDNMASGIVLMKSLAQYYTGSKPLKVLFIGNSYTGGIRDTLNNLIGASPYSQSIIEYAVRGGWTLRQHLNDRSTISRIESAKWDYVVLQEQSQAPTLPEKCDEFYDAAVALSTIIRQSGAKPVLYMTWGRRDKDTQNPKINPDYETMQMRLTMAYKEAAKKADALIAPVGQAWRSVRRDHPNLWSQLYRDDGSHPSKKGAYLAACVFYATLFKSDPTQLDFSGSLSGSEAGYFKAEAAETVRRIQRDGSVTPSSVDSPNAKYVGIIENDAVWKDTDGNEIWCNGGHVIKEKDTFYWVGYETKPKMGFRNIKLYSSANLADWKFENNILQNKGPQSILTWAGRPALLHNRRTGKYVLVFEASSKQWHRHKVGFASCRTIGGEYKLQAYQCPQDEHSTGDQSVYQEGDSAYLVAVLDHPNRESINYSLAIYKLSPDFLSVDSKVFEGFRNCRREAPHIIKRENQYYWFTSGLEYWNSTATMYATAPVLSGPWSELKVLSTEPVSIDSFNTQHDFIIPVIGSESTTYVYVGDRYTQHHGQGVGRNVFLPLVWDNDRPKLKWVRTWTPDTATGLYETNDTLSHKHEERAYYVKTLSNAGN